MSAAGEHRDRDAVGWMLAVEDRVHTLERMALFASGLAIVALSFALVAFMAILLS